MELPNGSWRNPECCYCRLVEQVTIDGKPKRPAQTQLAANLGKRLAPNAFGRGYINDTTWAEVQQLRCGLLSTWAAEALIHHHLLDLLSLLIRKAR